jgi:hypothetical protein
MWDLVEHQIENARLLGTIDKGRPRPASLRRAVSTAYYALFQSLCWVCADAMIGRRKPLELFTPIFRALDHQATARVLTESTPATAPELVRIGLAFRELKAAREWADYSPEPRPEYVAGKRDTSFTRQEALTLIDAAAAAIRIIDQLDDDARLRLATRLVPRSRK